MDVSVFASAYEGLRALTGLAKGLLDVKEEAAIRAKTAEILGTLIEVQGGLLEAQSNMQLLIDENRRLQEALDAKTKLDSYKLVEPYPGTRLYAPIATSEVEHFICPRCRDIDKELSVLQGGKELLYCPDCKRSFRVAVSPPKPQRRSAALKSGGLW